ncbi:MAG: AI-2E family transporter [Bacteroidales bacterium]|nr:AI-2E family transporter [Bacteroidales bacterium]MBN2749900.1 AI-2E family transporter [Bacteroidales bacterium]
MISTKVNLPDYAKISLILIGLIAFFAIIYIAKSIILLLTFAVIIAVVLHPMVNFFVRLGVNRVLSIVIVLLTAFIVIGLFAALIFSQVIRFSESWPLLVDSFTEILNNSIAWVSSYFDISTKKITGWIAETKADLINSSGAIIGSTLISVGSMLALVFVLPVYIFLILYYQPILLEFFHRIFGADNRAEVVTIIGQIKVLIQRYLVGLSIEVVIVATLFSVGLLILGIEYAIILGVIGALLNLIPYLGAIMGAVLPMVIAIATKPSPWTALLVLALYIVVQFIDNNYIVPKVVASQVKISILVSLTAVLVFGMLWGIPGMFIAIPLTGIMKLIFDHVESLKTWGFLLGDTMPKSPIISIKPIIEKIIGKGKANSSSKT